MSLPEKVKSLWLSGDLNSFQYMEIYSQACTDPKKGAKTLNEALETNGKLKLIKHIST